MSENTNWIEGAKSSKALSLLYVIARKRVRTRREAKGKVNGNFVIFRQLPEPRRAREGWSASPLA
jgi:hypothetical protein